MEQKPKSESDQSLTSEECLRTLSELKKLVATTKNNFYTLRNALLKKFPSTLTDIKDDHLRLQCIVENLSLSSDEIYGSNDYFSFDSDFAEVQELTKICSENFPDYKVHWTGPEDNGGEYPSIELDKKTSKEAIDKVRKELAIVKTEATALRQKECELASTLSRMENE